MKLDDQLPRRRACKHKDIQGHDLIAMLKVIQEKENNALTLKKIKVFVDSNCPQPRKPKKIKSLTGNLLQDLSTWEFTKLYFSAIGGSICLSLRNGLPQLLNSTLEKISTYLLAMSRKLRPPKELS